MCHQDHHRFAYFSTLVRFIEMRVRQLRSSWQLREKVQAAPPASEAHNNGFTLLEIVVAIAVLALSGSAIFRVTSDSIVHTRRADAWADATLLAQSLLARIGKDIALREGEILGVSSTGLRWRVRMERYGEAEDRRQWPVAAYSVVAEVGADGVASLSQITMTTLRLGPKETGQ